MIQEVASKRYSFSRPILAWRKEEEISGIGTEVKLFEDAGLNVVIGINKLLYVFVRLKSNLIVKGC